MFRFGKTIKVTTDPDLIKILLERGVEAVYPARKVLENRLLSGISLKVYYGIDPTGPSIHLGHAATILKLRDFQNLGHQVIVLVGDFTAMIGDPDKLSTRVPLTPEEIKKNMRSYLDQLGKLLDLDKTKIVYNSHWLRKLNFEDILKLAGEFTVSQMLERDMFQERIKNNRPIYLHEFLYPLMQGYDSVALGVDVEVGGNDQIFNMLAGRQLMKNRGREKFVIAGKLLVDSSGKKMGKTEGNMSRLNDMPEDIYGRIMSWPDELILPGAEICTRMSLETINLTFSNNPRDAKMLLAKEVTRLIHGEKAAQKAEKNFVSAFQKGELTTERKLFAEKSMETIALVKLIQLDISNSQAWRLVEAKALEINGVTVSDPKQKLDLKTGDVVRLGKKDLVQIEIK